MRKGVVGIFFNRNYKFFFFLIIIQGKATWDAKSLGFACTKKVKRNEKRMKKEKKNNKIILLASYFLKRMQRTIWG